MVRTELDTLQPTKLRAPRVYYRSPDLLRAVFGFENTPGLIYTTSMGREAYRGQHYPDELKLQELLSQGIPLLIPRIHLFGRQEMDSYDNRKRVLAERELNAKGIQFLMEEPVITCALPTPNGLQIVIIDGHHRTRYSSKYNIHVIPCLVYTPQQLVEAFNIRHGTNHDARSLMKQLGEDVRDALDSFSRMPVEKAPKAIGGYTNPQDLPFGRFQPKVA